MNPRLPRRRLPTAVVSLALVATFGIGAPPLRADAATQPAPAARKWDRMGAMEATNKEIADQPQGIHKISDGTIVIKSDRGLATVRADGHGCGTGCNGEHGQPLLEDKDLMVGVWFAVFMNPQDGTDLGITPEKAARLKDAYNYMDNLGTFPLPVLKLYEEYMKAPDGKAKTDAEKALMDKVRAVGQAYVDCEAKKLKDVKALLTPAQIINLRTFGAKMVRPFEKPIS